MFTFEPLLNLFLGVSKLFKYFMVQYTSSSNFSKKSTAAVANLVSPVPPKHQFSEGVTPYCLNFNYAMHDWDEDGFLQSWMFISTERYIPQNGLIGILEHKEYRSLDLFFPFIFSYADKSTVLSEDTPLMNIHINYTDNIRRIISHKFSNGCTINDLQFMWEAVCNFRKTVWKLFRPHCEHGLNTPKFHFLYHVMNDLERF